MERSGLQCNRISLSTYIYIYILNQMTIDALRQKMMLNASLGKLWQVFVFVFGKYSLLITSH